MCTIRRRIATLALLFGLVAMSYKLSFIADIGKLRELVVYGSAKEQLLARSRAIAAQQF